MPTKRRTVKEFFPEVTSVTDAKKPIHIIVTAKDSNAATVKNHKECAMARAAKRTLHVDGIVVSRQRAYLVTGNKAIRYTFPESVRKEIVSFDRGGGFAEGEYVLTPIPPHVPKPKSAKPEPRHEESPEYVRKFKHTTTGIRESLVGKAPQ